jgi:hypothetical protein
MWHSDVAQWRAPCLWSPDILTNHPLTGAIQAILPRTTAQKPHSAFYSNFSSIKDSVTQAGHGWNRGAPMTLAVSCESLEREPAGDSPVQCLYRYQGAE